MERLFVYLTDLSSGVAYFIILGVLLACGLGFPLPEDIPLIATGYLIWDGTLQIHWALLITMAGVLIGDSLIFYFGRSLGMRLLGAKTPLFSPKKIRRTRAYFRKYGDKIVFFARFFAGFRSVAFFMAGATKMKFSRFIWLDGLAALLSVPVWIAVGYAAGTYLGDEITKILKGVKEVKTAITLVIITVVLIVVFRSLFKYQRAKREPLKSK